MNLGRTLDHKT